MRERIEKLLRTLRQYDPEAAAAVRHDLNHGEAEYSEQMEDLLKDLVKHARGAPHTP